MHDRVAYIFVGQSGSGKGTQILLLDQKLLAQNPLSVAFHVETGKVFRELIEQTSYTGARVKEYIEAGKLPPSFLGVHAWAHTLVSTYNGEEIMFLDGTPRMIDEIPILLSAIAFYNLKPVVINVKVGDEWAYEKTKARGRTDDQNESELRGKVEWYHRRVEPVIDMLAKDPSVTVVTINGEQSIEQVHADICKAVGIA